MIDSGGFRGVTLFFGECGVLKERVVNCLGYWLRVLSIEFKVGLVFIVVVIYKVGTIKEDIFYFLLYC